MKGPKISVVITGLNRSEELKELFHSILNQKIKPYEVIYVDGGSNDDSVEVAKKYNVKVIVDHKARTPASGRNIGLQVSSGDFVLFLDSDCILRSDFMEKCHEIAKELSENIVGFGAGYRYLDIDYSNSIVKIFTKALECTLVNGGSPQFKIWSNRKFVDRLPGGNSCYRRDILLKLGGFNAKLNYCEEVELGNRLRKQGLRLLYIPELLIFHKPFQSTRNLLKKIITYGYWRGWYFFKQAFSFPLLFMLIFVMVLIISCFILHMCLFSLIILTMYIFLISADIIIEARSFNFPMLLCAALTIHSCYLISFSAGIIHRFMHDLITKVRKFN